MSEPLFVLDNDDLRGSQTSSEDKINEEERVEAELTELLKADNNESSRNSEVEYDHIPVTEKVVPRSTDTQPKELDINLTLNLEYQQQIVQDLIFDDGLVILGKGLGLTAIVANLLHVLSLSVIKDKKSLILLMNASEFENFKIGEELMELSWLDETKKKVSFQSIGGDAMTIEKRRKIYKRGGILSISNRILVTDLLADIIDANIVTGIVVLHSERVREYSTERFIINLYRRTNKWGFIKAFSEDPENFTVGFQPLYNKLKFLKIERAMLWPRFHVDVTQSLRSRKTETKVTELSIGLTGYMLKIQTGLMACIEACVGELRRQNPELMTDYWSMENALDENFVKSIRVMLEPSWHRLSNTTKQVIHDLSTLKTLLSQLFSYDAVQFYQILVAIVDANKPSVTNRNKVMAPWLMLDEAMTVISCAKSRIFHKIRESGEDGDEATTYLLEELPKWEQLALILDDINEESEKSGSHSDGPTLIMCSSQQVCAQLRRFLTSYKEHKCNNRKSFSGRKMMISLLKQHLNWKKRDGSRSVKIQSELNKKPENNLPVHSDIQSNNDEMNISRTFVRRRVAPTKRRRNRGGSTMASYDRMLSKNDDQNVMGEVDDTMIEKLETQLSDIESGDNDDDITESMKVDPVDDFEAFVDEFDNADTTEQSHHHALIYEFIERTDQIIIERFGSRSANLLLDELMPSHIILYEPNLGFIRETEVYQSQRTNNLAKCYFLYYGGSIEEQSYLKSIKKEKDAFTTLIREKANLPNTFVTDEDEVAKFAPDLRTPVNTRIAGGNPVAVKRQVIVDIREFRSQLPFLCHLSNLEVIPCMITVGDYIISPKICIERKSIPDLIGSLKSGRLYQQCEQMFRYYELPTLLIEFEEGKSFSLEPFTAYRNGGPGMASSVAVGPNFQLQDLQLKLMMLLVSFPSLKIIWSSSPFETARLFKELKMNQDEPDLNKSINAGLNPFFDKDTYFNDASIDLVQNIPGITSVNCHLITNKVKNLKELSGMGVSQLGELIGAEAATKVVSFFNRNV
ncbi:hypothetical protein CANARDRAFT_27288 [[Candida] arabinofermentans NRRL YB-2248]|uniref:ERCC4 domain-containing protein n=1 Tax=[Candida] arabinofermentans NRRL YB-2248 TaxID=983967 RepID=A0A1E4T5A8_9ASCO|nr:hypothetical protein CANARDRAFT_27288 [[Candida] arabinofermentans NRRL YB-2248]